MDISKLFTNSEEIKPMNKPVLLFCTKGYNYKKGAIRMNSEHKWLQCLVGGLIFIMLALAIWIVPKSMYHYSMAEGVEKLHDRQWNAALEQFTKANRISQTKESHDLSVYANKMKLREDMKNLTLRYEGKLNQPSAIEQESRALITRYEPVKEINFLTEKARAILSDSMR